MAFELERESAEAQDALYIALGPLSEQAQPFFAAQHGIAVWQASELAHALRGQPHEA